MRKEDLPRERKSLGLMLLSEGWGERIFFLTRGREKGEDS